LRLTIFGMKQCLRPFSRLSSHFRFPLFSVRLFIKIPISKIDKREKNQLEIDPVGMLKSEAEKE